MFLDSNSPSSTRCSIWQPRNPHDREQHAQVNSRVFWKRRRDGRIRKQRSFSSSSVIDPAFLELRFVIRSYDFEVAFDRPRRFTSVETLVRNKARRTNPPSRASFVLQAWRCAYAGLFPRRWERPIDRSFLANSNFGHGDCTPSNSKRMENLGNSLLSSRIAFNTRLFFYTYFMYAVIVSIIRFNSIEKSLAFFSLTLLLLKI